VPVVHPSRTRVVAFAPEVEAIAAMWPDRACDADRLTRVLERAALLHVQLDERADAGESPRIRPDIGRIDTGDLHRVAEAQAVVVGQRQRPRRRDRAGQQSRTEAGHAET